MRACLFPKRKEPIEERLKIQKKKKREMKQEEEREKGKREERRKTGERTRENSVFRREFLEC